MQQIEFLTQQEPNHDPAQGRIGDCWPTVIECLARVRQGTVPKLPMTDWKGQLREALSWMRDHAGLCLVTVNASPLVWEIIADVPVSAGGESPRGDFDHAIVACNGRLLHDPHPTRAGLAGDGPTTIDLFVPESLDHQFAALARPLEDWHEDDGEVLWWRFPIQEAPYVGDPRHDDWPGYHTHWTPLVIPKEPPR